jgi:hypothetical protein
LASKIDQKKSTVQKTISIPTSIQEVKKLAAQNKIENPVVEETSEVELVEEIAALPIEKTQLENAIHVLIERFKEENKSLEITVLKQSWELIDGNEIQFHLSGELQVDVFNKMKNETVIFLKETLSNSNLQLSYEVKEVVESGKKLYTSTDKLNYLLKKHPALLSLKTKFGLETDF